MMYPCVVGGGGWGGATSGSGVPAQGRAHGTVEETDGWRRTKEEERSMGGSHKLERRPRIR